jgi:DNA polymerase III sliding clamp (beta) subunit (PCNA family)
MSDLKPKDYKTLTLGYKTIIVPSDKVAKLISLLDECSEVERDYDETGTVFTVKDGVRYSIASIEFETKFK